MPTKHRPGCAPILRCAAAVLLALVPGIAARAELPDDLLAKTGFQGGLIVCCGCDDVAKVAELAAGDGRVVHLLMEDPAKVQAARAEIAGRGLCGKVGVAVGQSGQLPYIDNTVNLLVGAALGDISEDEVLRVLCPDGKAYVRDRDRWAVVVKPRPDSIDQWTHYLHDPGNNAVAHDREVGPPRHLQWTGGPRWSRHHDHMSSMSAMVSAEGRVFYIFDEGQTGSILTPAKWKLVARDAFNGVVLWKRDIRRWWTQWWPLKSGPATLPRRLVATGSEVYSLLSLLEPVSALDAATGAIRRHYAGTEGAEEIVKVGDTLLVLVNRTMPGLDSTPQPEQDQKARNFDGRITKSPMMQHLWADVQSKKWLNGDRVLMAFRADTAELLWKKASPVVPLTLAADERRVYYHQGERIEALDLKSGELLYATEPVPITKDFMMSFFGPVLVVYDGVIVFAGGEKLDQAWMGYGRPDQGEDTMTAFSATTGEKLWTAPHPYGGYQSPEDVLIADGLVWTAATTQGNKKGTWYGRDLQTGEVAKEIPPTLSTRWFHHRCYRAKATDRFLLPSRNGIEFIDLAQQQWGINHWVRSACLYGVMPANGLLYVGPHSCACHPQAKLCGFNALAAPRQTGEGAGASDSPQLEKGPAFDAIEPLPAGRHDWPTYRADAARSGCTSASLPARLTADWIASLQGKLTQPVVRGTLLVVASSEHGIVYGLDAANGQRCWQYYAGGRVDSPPTIARGHVVFGSADGYVTCLRASDGALAWRFRAAPVDRRLVAYGQVESVWPVHGSVLVDDDEVMFVAGRSFHLDGGVRFFRLELASGRVLGERVMDELDEHGVPLQAKGGLDMPVALPDILSSMNDVVFMRAQAMDRNGNPLRTKKHHLFAPYGFTDDSWFHRSYWVFGLDYFGGCGGYPRAAQMFPSGRMVVFDGETVFAFGREQKYLRWITPIEYHLFASRRTDVPQSQADNGSSDDAASQQKRKKQRPRVTFAWSTKVPVLVRAMVKCGDRLFLAGPPDLVDEEELVQRLPQPDTLEALARQDSAYDGGMGTRLWAVSATDGQKLTELEFDGQASFDGICAAAGRLYMAMEDGRLVALRPHP